MNVLILGKSFYDYNLKIKKEFENEGDVVNLYSDVPNNHLIIRKILGKKLEKKAISNHLNKYFKSNINIKYDLVLVLVGRYLTEEFLITLQKNNPNARFVLYLWDDIARVENYTTTNKYYDSIYSFDTEDCKQNPSFVFLPLFYTNEYKSLDKKRPIYDIYGSFSDHSGRKRIAIDVDKQCELNGLKAKFIFVPGRFKYIKDYFANLRIRKTTKCRISFCYKSISSSENINYISTSKCLLDIQYESQNGLTMRSIESVGAKVKLVTTNKNIMKYDFYCPENCFILDRLNPIINIDFFNIPFKELPSSIYKKYSLTSWVNVIKNQDKVTYLRDNYV